MRIESPMMIILLIALAFTIIGLIVGEFRMNYPAAGNVNTSYESRYNYVSQTNISFWNIDKDIKKLADEQEGWKRLLGGTIIFAKSVIVSITSVILSIPYVTAIVTGICNELKIPPEIISIFIVMIVGGIIFALIKFVNKSPTDV